jgi:colanic acid/amylovoran biosynthesis glycosyltransferase
LYGTGYGTSAIARELGIPYVPIVEYDLTTQITVATSQATSSVRRLVRTARCVRRHVFHDIPELRNAHAIHCNGYPIFDVAKRYNPNCLLYLDSRMSGDMVIPSDELARRVTTREGRPLRLLYSGRYERLKGADDVVRVAAERLRRNLDIEMHCYGQGSLVGKMRDTAAASARPERILIHDAVPYTELVGISRSFDLFVCCHIQNDPSCTYFESFGAGLPIVGCSNRMWQRLCEPREAVSQGRCIGLIRWSTSSRN